MANSSAWQTALTWYVQVLASFRYPLRAFIGQHRERLADLISIFGNNATLMKDIGEKIQSSLHSDKHEDVLLALTRLLATLSYGMLLSAAPQLKPTSYAPTWDGGIAKGFKDVWHELNSMSNKRGTCDLCEHIKKLLHASQGQCVKLFPGLLTAGQLALV